MSRYPHIALGLLLFAGLALLSSCVETDWQPAPAPEYTIATPSLAEHDVLRMERFYRVRIDETVRTRVFVPAADQAPIQGDFPVVLFAHGGAVIPDRYDWLCAHIASRGFVVLAPRHALNLPIFARGNLLDVLHTARRAADSANDPLNGVIDDGKVAALGHSLGGVIAGYAWFDYPGKVSHLGLLASYPDGAEHADRLAPAIRDSEYVLSVIGGRDGLLEVDQAARELAPVDAPKTLAVVEGMNHFQFTDEISSGEASRDREPTIDTEDARRLVLYLVDGWLDDFANDQEARLRNTDQWPDGLMTGEAFRAE